MLPKLKDVYFLFKKIFWDKTLNFDRAEYRKVCLLFCDAKSKVKNGDTNPGGEGLEIGYEENSSTV
ncbi:hypothetical protein [Ureibacillus aquaedulcis]|uniref:Uncharacterized protein n=1 Tax=Ureibacillus aquaedulcis TaxID=3058421 RepID=A0ABT8GTN0_9BACL|nr:hypothetical protein [Ureibacillus sp. BA0131]MDN4494778.1 hypothetical protein [Ureibacillus sp. BA0131]